LSGRGVWTKPKSEVGVPIFRKAEQTVHSVTLYRHFNKLDRPQYSSTVRIEVLFTDLGTASSICLVVGAIKSLQYQCVNDMAYKLLNQQKAK